MPYSIILHCYPSRDMQSQDTNGHTVYAAFLKLVQEASVEVADSLTAEATTKAFTTAWLFPTNRQGIAQTPQQAKTPNASHQNGSRTSQKTAHNPKMTIPAGTRCGIRITLLDDTLYPVLVKPFLDQPGKTIRLGKTELVVAELRTTGDDDDLWCGYASYEELVEKEETLRQTSPGINADTMPREITVSFASPTVFRTGNVTTPLPIPELVFGSWLRSWDAFAPVPHFNSNDERAAFCNDVISGNVAVSYRSLRVEGHPISKGGKVWYEIGFVGRCTFAFPKKVVSDENVTLLNKLADYSFFSGTGTKTTMGMGRTRRVDDL